jgi:hypothetical protein
MNTDKGYDMNDNIVFYCKDCGQMFYASVNSLSAFDEDSTQEVAKLLLDGHRMETTDTANVRANFKGCECS